MFAKLIAALKSFFAGFIKKPSTTPSVASPTVQATPVAPTPPQIQPAAPTPAVAPSTAPVPGSIEALQAAGGSLPVGSGINPMIASMLGPISAEAEAAEQAQRVADLAKLASTPFSFDYWVKGAQNYCPTLFATAPTASISGTIPAGTYQLDSGGASGSQTNEMLFALHLGDGQVISNQDTFVVAADTSATFIVSLNNDPKWGAAWRGRTPPSSYGAYHLFKHA